MPWPKAMCEPAARVTSSRSGSSTRAGSWLAELSTTVTIDPAGTGTPARPRPPADLQVLGGEAEAGHRHRAVEAQQLLDGVRDPLGLPAQQLVLVGVGEQREHRVDE